MLSGEKRKIGNSGRIRVGSEGRRAARWRRRRHRRRRRDDGRREGPRRAVEEGSCDRE